VGSFETDLIDSGQRTMTVSCEGNKQTNPGSLKYWEFYKYSYVRNN